MRRKRRKAWLYFLIGYVYTFIKFINDYQTKLTMTMTVILKMAMIVTVTMMVMRVFF